MSYICHIDEARCSASLPATKSDVQPLLVIAGLIAHEDAPPYITREFLALKRRYCPGAFTSKHRLDDVRQEIKRAGAKNVILLIGDGMGDSEITIARWSARPRVR